MRILKILALGGVAGFVVLLWPIFVQAETSLAIIFVALSFAGIGIGAFASEVLVVDAIIILTAFIGGIAGAGTGGVLGARRTRRINRAS